MQFLHIHSAYYFYITVGRIKGIFKLNSDKLRNICMIFFRRLMKIIKT